MLKKSTGKTISNAVLCTVLTMFFGCANQPEKGPDQSGLPTAELEQLHGEFAQQPGSIARDRAGRAWATIGMRATGACVIGSLAHLF